MDNDEKEKALTNTKFLIEEFFVKNHWTAKVILDPYTNHPFITSTIYRSFLTQFLGEKKYEHPSDIWELFKYKYFPNWLKKYFPVKMKTVIFNFRAVFPDYKPPELWKHEENISLFTTY